MLVVTALSRRCAAALGSGRRSSWWTSWWAAFSLFSCQHDGASASSAARAAHAANAAHAAGGTAATPQEQSDGCASCGAASDAGPPSVGLVEDVVATTAADAAAPSATMVGVVLMGLRLRPTPDARGADASVDLELREDGSLYRRGALVARFEGERLIDAQGREVLRLARDRVVMIAGLRTTQRLMDSGELRRPDGRVLRVEDNGAVVMVDPSGAREVAPMRFEGFRPAARATASLLLMYLALQP